MVSVLDRVHSPAPDRLAAEPKPQATFYHPELNSLRFVAFLLVFLDHSLVVVPNSESVLYAGAYGVPVFFALSAYLIISLLVREEQVSGTIRLRYFYVRRILRIWPLYFAALLAGFLLGRLHEGIWMPWKMLLSYLLLAGNFYVARNGWADSPTSILWSLSIEEQFYLVIPLVAKYLGSRALRVTCWLATLSAFPVLIHRGLHHTHQGDNIQVNLFVCFQFFGVGGLLALHPQVGLCGRKVALRIVSAVAGLACFVVAAERFARASLSRHLALSLCCMNVLVLAGTALIFLAFLNYPARRRSFPGYLGVISYGLYVFHPWCLELCAELRDRYAAETAVMNLACDLVALLLTLLIASVSFKLFERPTLKLKQRFEVVRTLRI